MKDDAFDDFLTPRTEEIKIKGQTLVVRELTAAEMLPVMRDVDDHERTFAVFNAAVSRKDGKPMPDAHTIPSGIYQKLLPIALRVNGLVDEDETGEGEEPGN